MSGWRLNSGGLIDRSRGLRFRWGGQPFEGHPGDTLASALLANGVDIVGRSFKYHRPRGLLGAGLEEPNAIVQLGEGATTVPNRKATEVELFDGLSARAVNAWPSPELDLMAVNGLAKRFIPAAFYYKTFTWPHWRWFEPAIRRAAGLGRAPASPDPDRYDQRHAHVDLLVVGGGLAGLIAALEAGRTGRQVWLVEGDALLGGAIFGRQAAQQRAEAGRLLAELAGLPNVTCKTRTLAVGYHDHNLVSLVQRLTDHLPENARHGPRQRLWKLRANDVVLATGAIERPLVFDGNDLPGVMLASAAGLYLERHAVAPGRRIVLATNNDRAWEAALALAHAGVAVEAILDARADVEPALNAAARAAGIVVETGTTVEQALGRRAVAGVRTTRLDPTGHATGEGRRIACDSLLVSGGFSPVVHLHSQAGGTLAWHDRLQGFVPAHQPQACRSVGAAAGDLDLSLRPLWQVVREGAAPSASAWVDFQNDVTAGDVAIAHREAFRSVEHLKRYTTLGMASDQGKTSNVNGLAILGALLGKGPAEVGTTRFRPPYDPSTMGAYAGHRRGDLLRPAARLPAHAAHAALGAAFEEYGSWQRPAFYPRAGEDEAEAVAREAATVRKAAGLFDASPLGKIEVKGPDAAAFLDRLYVGTISTLKPGRCRYGLMLNEHGILFDDGVVARIAEDHFLVGTTSGHASAVQALFQEWLQCEWTDLGVASENVTQGWAVMNVAGPDARTILQNLETDIDLSADAFPHLSHREGMLEGVRCRIQRVSFSGELSFELAVHTRHATALHDRLMDAGAAHGITPFGVEALMVLRTEKGFLHIGSDTDGMTLPQDIGFGGPVTAKKTDFVGRRSCLRPDAQRPDRRQFVGLQSLDGRLLPVGGHVLKPGEAPPALSQGWVTSSVHAPTIGRPHALAMIEGGRARMGEEVQIWDLGTSHRARIIEPCAFDPEGVRMNG
jgi:sarcosine oxidase, subunit alpha